LLPLRSTSSRRTGDFGLLSAVFDHVAAGYARLLRWCLRRYAVVLCC